MRTQLIAIRDYMRRNGIDLCYVPTADYHASEYVGDYFKTREYLTGFTGSAGTAVVTADRALLWTDGRYFIQAEKELAGSGFELCRMGVKDVPTVEKFIESEAKEGWTISLDGRVTDAATGEKLSKIAEKNHLTLRTDPDPFAEIWPDRPSISKVSAWELGLEYCGESRADKIKWLAEEVEKKECGAHVIAALDDIGWLLNIRGGDVTHVPVMLAYLIMENGKVTLYAMDEAVAPVRAALEADGVSIRPYDAFYEDLAKLPADMKVLVDKRRSNYQIISRIPGEIKDENNPCVLRKSIKNETELKNTVAAHVKDGVALTKFMYWLKKEIGNPDCDLTEATAADRLEEFRREQGAMDVSFDTISAYNANAAMMHYEAEHETAAKLEAQGMLLVDSGGHYMEGTTDVTRTIVLGPIPDEWKFHYTMVCKSMINLAKAKFLYGCSGLSLDILARGPLWDLGLDYRCGTGHGVGYLLNIHEAPNGFRYKSVPERHDGCMFEEGMITTDEPGLYIEGSHGIRIENELICRKGQENEYGQFMEFEIITYAPIDLEALDFDLFTDAELKYLNDYHKMVYDTISPYLNQEECEWLRNETRQISR
ncbi:MAG: aminopeptidase P family protein [Lachnospiraceae bacterium]|nr:aminopeptidase P family protein [Lachnospiraceae bacterium]